MALNISISLSEETLKKVQEAADLSNSDIDSIIAEHVENTFPNVDEIKTNQEIENRRQMWLHLHPELVKTYLDKYVAIKDGKVIDSDVRRHLLAKRIYKDDPFNYVMIRKVTIDPDPPIRMRSIRFAPSDETNL